MRHNLYIVQFQIVSFLPTVKIEMPRLKIYVHPFCDVKESKILRHGSLGLVTGRNTGWSLRMSVRRVFAIIMKEFMCFIPRAIKAVSDCCCRYVPRRRTQFVLTHRCSQKDITVLKETLSVPCVKDWLLRDSATMAVINSQKSYFGPLLFLFQFCSFVCSYCKRWGEMVLLYC